MDISGKPSFHNVKKTGWQNNKEEQAWQGIWSCLRYALHCFHKGILKIPLDPLLSFHDSRKPASVCQPNGPIRLTPVEQTLFLLTVVINRIYCPLPASEASIERSLGTDHLATTFKSSLRISFALAPRSTVMNLILWP